MTEREAFIEAILREPEEDTHRLAFADSLDEQDAASSDAAWASLIREM